jgi:hypothetical protein
MRKRAKNVQAAIDKINTLLALEHVTIIKRSEDKGTQYLFMNSSEPAAQAYKQGLVVAIDAILTASNSYRGYKPLSESKSREFDRIYY